MLMTPCQSIHLCVWKCCHLFHFMF